MRKAQKEKLHAAGIKMLRWTCGVSKIDKVGNNIIRVATKVVAISKKMQERRLQWYGHVRRREKSYLGIGR